LRRKTVGSRGKSRFARQLGLSPSTYDYYEGSRTPPADVLIRIAEVANVDLQWLLTGRQPAERLKARDHPVLRRAAALLADRPDAAGPLDAFIQLLVETHKFPAKPQADERVGVETPRPAPSDETPQAGTPQAETTPASPAPPPAPPGREDWIPVLGRTAAGIARFWGAEEDTSGLTTLADLLARRAAWRPRSVRPAVAATGEGQASAAVQLVTLSAPDESDVAEFVSAGPIKRAHPAAFALRVDGDSMAPQIEPGDLVILSPSAAAVEGQAAVVQLAGQIGVTCKLYRTAGEQVHLVPVNAQYEIAKAPASSVEWALRILARVKA
jgi:transcriptional regulator with XRE-family HTH domain